MPPNVRTHPFAIRFIFILLYFLLFWFHFISASKGRYTLLLSLIHFSLMPEIEAYCCVSSTVYAYSNENENRNFTRFMTVVFLYIDIVYTIKPSDLFLVIIFIYSVFFASMPYCIV
jgi:hypothetical protein